MTHQPLAELWVSALYDRDAYILQERLTRTLEEIGNRLSISRERVRQLEGMARTRLRAALVAEYGEDELKLLRSSLDSQLVVDDAYLTALLGDGSEPVKRVCMQVLDVFPVAAWGLELDGWWTSRPESVKAALKELAAGAPFRSDELIPRTLGVGLPSEFPSQEIIESSGSPLRRHPAGPWWVRRSATQRDAAYLWLLERGESSPIGPIAIALRQEENSAREGMRRDERFVLLRPMGLWSLAEWNLPYAGFSGALEAVVSILADLGPLPYETLRKEVQKVYPVTDWRIAQCLASSQIGRMSSGDVGLVRDGALLIEEEPPKRPMNVLESDDGQLIAFTTPVDSDLLRGSGIIIPRYVGWRLNLMHAPESREFDVPQSHDFLVITRHLSGTQMTALRRWAIDLGVTEGCRLAITLRLDSNVARILHGCGEDNCPLATAE